MIPIVFDEKIEMKLVPAETSVKLATTNDSR
jgi:hypothetical protein